MTGVRPVRLESRQLAAYGALGLPLAFAALPIYVYAPKFYAALGLSLAGAGAVLLLSRVADAFIDPWLGAASDRARSLKRFVGWALVPLAAGLLAMFNPPASVPPGPWLAATVCVVTLGFSAASIAYQAWGARVGDRTQKTAVTATREAFGLAGVMLASILPQLFAPTVEAGLPATAIAFTFILVACAAATLLAAPSAPPAPPDIMRAGGIGSVLASTRMRQDISLNIVASGERGALFTVAYHAADPKVAMRVVEQLASLFEQENRLDQARLDAANGPRELLGDGARKLIGEPFRILEPARLPQRPIEPVRLLWSSLGAAAGLIVAFVTLLLQWWPRPRRGRPEATALPA